MFLYNDALLVDLEEVPISGLPSPSKSVITNDSIDKAVKSTLGANETDPDEVFRISDNLNHNS